MIKGFIALVFIFFSVMGYYLIPSISNGDAEKNISIMMDLKDDFDYISIFYKDYDPDESKSK